MTNQLKWGIAAISAFVVAFLIWNSLRSPQAEQIDRNTQELIKMQCEISPTDPECQPKP